MTFDPSPQPRSADAPDHLPGAERARFARGVSLYYGALFLIYGAHLPYFPVWLDWRGLSTGEVATIVAAPFFVRFVASPVIGLWADSRRRHRHAALLLSWLAVLAAVVLSQLSTFWTILAAAVVLSLAMTSVMPLIETIAVSGVRTYALDYGRMRLWGSATFIVASVGGGELIARFGAGVAVWLVVAACLTTALAAHYLPLSSDERQVPVSGRQRTPSSQHAIADLRSAWLLMRAPPFLLLLIAGGLAQAGHATYYAFGTLHWLDQGISPLAAGALWAIGVIAEIVLFAFGARTLARIGAARLLLIATLAAVIRWSLTALDPPFALLVGLQCLHALTFGAAHLAAIELVSRMVPDRLQGTGQALCASVGMGLAMGGAMLMSGWLYAAYAGHAYLGMAALGLLGALATWALMKRWDGELLPLCHEDTVSASAP